MGQSQVSTLVSWLGNTDFYLHLSLYYSFMKKTLRTWKRNPTDPQLHAEIGENVSYVASCIVFDETGENILLVEERHPYRAWWFDIF